MSQLGQDKCLSHQQTSVFLFTSFQHDLTSFNSDHFQETPLTENNFPVDLHTIATFKLSSLISKHPTLRMGKGVRNNMCGGEFGEIS